MTDAINTQNRLRNTAVSTDTKAGSPAKSNPSSGDAKSSADSVQDAAVVELSTQALLEDLSEQIKNLPEVNEVRVEAVKQAISNGEYQADAEVIARKYAEIESLLP